MKKERIVMVLSHNDLDGIISAVVGSFAIDSLIKGFPEYAGVKHSVRFLRGVDEAKNVIADVCELGIQPVVTDLSIGRDEFRLVAGMEPFIPELPLLVDHHMESQSFDCRRRTMVSMKSCAAMNSMKYYSALPGEKKVHFPEWLSRLVVLANDYDMWIHAEPESRKLKSLADILGPVGLYFRILSEREDFSPATALSERWISRQKRRVEKAASEASILTSLDGKTTCAVVPPQFPFSTSDANELSECLASRRRCDCMVYIYAPESESKMGPVRISLRGKKGVPRQFLSLLRQSEGVSGGGHENSCGCRFPAHVKHMDAFDILTRAAEKFLGIPSEVEMYIDKSYDAQGEEIDFQM